MPSEISWFKYGTFARKTGHYDMAVNNVETSLFRIWEEYFEVTANEMHHWMMQIYIYVCTVYSVEYLFLPSDTHGPSIFSCELHRKHCYCGWMCGWISCATFWWVVDVVHFELVLLGNVTMLVWCHIETYIYSIYFQYIRSLQCVQAGTTLWRESSSRSRELLWSGFHKGENDIILITLTVLNASRTLIYYVY